MSTENTSKNARISPEARAAKKAKDALWNELLPKIFAYDRENPFTINRETTTINNLLQYYIHFNHCLTQVFANNPDVHERSNQFATEFTDHIRWTRYPPPETSPEAIGKLFNEVKLPRNLMFGMMDGLIQVNSLVQQANQIQGFEEGDDVYAMIKNSHELRAKFARTSDENNIRLTGTLLPLGRAPDERDTPNEILFDPKYLMKAEYFEIHQTERGKAFFLSQAAEQQYEAHKNEIDVGDTLVGKELQGVCPVEPQSRHTLQFERGLLPEDSLNTDFMAALVDIVHYSSDAHLFRYDLTESLPPLRISDSQGFKELFLHGLGDAFEGITRLESDDLTQRLRQGNQGVSPETTHPQETRELQPEIEDKTLLVERAREMHHKLEEQLARERSRLRRLGFAVDKIALIDSDAPPTLQTHGFMGDQKWLYDVIQGILTNTPTKLWLPSPHVEVYRNSGIEFKWSDNSSPRRYINTEENSAILHGYPEKPEGLMRLISFLHAVIPDSNTTIELAQPDAMDRPTFFADANRLLREMFTYYGIPLDNKIKLVRDSDYLPGTHDVFDQLDQSEQGIIKAGEAHMDDTSFHPDSWMIDTYGSLISNSIPLQDFNGRPLASLIKLARLLAPENRGFTNVLFSDVFLSERNPDTDTAMLLRALGVADLTTLHLTSLKPSFPQTPYALGKAFQRQLEQFLTNHDAYTDFQRMDPIEYGDRNYKDIMKEDKEIIHNELAARDTIAEILGIDWDDPETLLKDEEMAHVCLGPNLYPVMASSVYTNGKILGIDFAESNVEHMKRVKRGERDVEKWQTFENHMVADENGGERYVGIADEAKNKLVPTPGDVRKLPKKKFKYVEMAFGAESIVPSPKPFHEIMTSIRESLTDENSVFVGTFMTNSIGWHGGDNTNFPAVPLTLTEIKAILSDVGFDITIAESIGENVAPEDKVRPEQGMAFIVATPRIQRKKLALAT